MCGIAGLIPDSGAGAFDPVRAEATAARMIAAIAHRGPNGLRVEAMAGLAVGHARLSIIDLEGGWQPLHHGGDVMIGNGEIYNYLELAQAFDLAGRLATGSDFEPLLQLFPRLGTAVFQRLRGMYGLCLRPDPASSDARPAFLARDVFGIKPLYTRRLDAGASEVLGEAASPVTLFASEPRALFAADGARPAVDRLRAEELLALNYTVSPGTAFRDVARLAPGVVTSDPRQKAFVAGTRAPTPISEALALERLDAVLEDSVRLHQRADVPYGLFLSGGVDSAAIATLMARLNSRPVTAFTCGFRDADLAAEGAVDERGSAERVATALGLDWRETAFGAEDFWRIAPSVAWALDDPTTDFACLPTYRLAEAAKGTLTVVLTGEGGDELFAGYGRYRRALRPGWLGGRAAEPQVFAPFLKDGGAGALARWRAAATPRPELTPLQQAQAADLETWLPNDLLLKLDRCLMAHGLEGRTPFLDPPTADFAFHLPDRLKVRGRHGKWLLRKWLDRHCPAADAWSRKRGFTTPVAAWIAPRARDLGPRIAAVQGVAEICDEEAVRAAFCHDGAAQTRWPLLFYALWWTIHIGGATAEEASEAVIGRM
jgi:asparagine synthase (glutamine-hydrolysing)